MTWAAWLIVFLPTAALCMTAFNLIVWPRGRPVETDLNYSVLVPARDEAATIESTVRSALAEPVHEVIVYDDQSTDGTTAVLRQLVGADARLRVIDGEDLPDGWVGKPHACHRLGQEATGDVLLFLDADVTLRRGAVGRLASIFRRFDADLVTAVPRQTTGALVERLVLPLLHVTYVSWLPLPLIWKSQNARFLAANGQLLAVRAAAHDAVGGFASVHDAIVDDMSFCAEMKRSGRRVVFADGFEMASCRMYDGAREVWRGFSKNVFEGLGSRPALFFVVGLYLATFVVGWFAVPVALSAVPALVLPSILAVAANVSQRVLLAARMRHPIVSVVAHPIGVLILCAIALNSWRWHARDEVTWAGRTYDGKAARSG